MGLSKKRKLALGLYTPVKIPDIEKYEERLPKVEVVCGNLYNSGQTTYQIADTIHVTQPLVIYRLKKLRRRIALMNRMPMLYTSNFKRDLGHILNEQQLSILTMRWNNRTQLEIAKAHGMTQHQVSAELLKILNILVDNQKRRHVYPYAEAFDFIQEHHKSLVSFRIEKKNVIF